MPVEAISRGQMIELLRRRRGVSREVLASLVGYSSEWLRQVERNERPVERLPVLLRLANILQVKDISGFLGLPDSSGPVRADGVVYGKAVHNALYEQWHLTLTQQRVIPTSRLRERIGVICTAWQDSPHRYSVLLDALPDLLREVWCGNWSEDPERWPLLVRLHRLTSAVLRQIGDHAMALLAIERGILVARVAKDELAEVGCLVTLARVLLASGAAAEARKLGAAAIDRMGSDISDTSPEIASLLGALHLVSIEAAALQADQPAVTHLLEKARDLARRLPNEKSYPAAVMGRADPDLLAMRLEVMLGRARSALRLAAEHEPTPGMTREQQTSYYVTLADAYLRIGNPVAATFTLLKAESECREEMRFNPVAKAILTKVLRQDNATVRQETWAMAERAGIV